MNGLIQKTLLATDPGWARAIGALRMLCAVILSLLLTYHLGQMAMVWAALTAFLFELGFYAVTTREKFFYGSLIFLSFSIGVLLGLLCRSHDVSSDLVLIATCFVAFYFRYLGPAYMMFPIVAFVFELMSTVLPVPFEAELWRNILPLAAGCGAALISSIVLFPARYIRLFFSNYGSFLKASADLIAWQEGALKSAMSAEQFQKERKAWISKFHELHNHSQVAITWLEKHGHMAENFSALLMTQLSISQSYSIINETLVDVLNKPELIKDPNVVNLITECLTNVSHFIQSLIQLTPYKNTLPENQKISLDRQSLVAFKTYLLHLDLAVSPSSIILFGLYTGCMHLMQYFESLASEARV